MYYDAASKRKIVQQNTKIELQDVNLQKAKQTIVGG
jgi:hypothetical protein